MLVNLNTKVVAFGTNGEPIELRGGEGPPPLGKIILHALRDVHYEIDQKLGVKEKLDRFLLEKRIDPVTYGHSATAPESVEMSIGEIKMVTERVGRIFLQAGLVGAVAELLDTTVPPPPKLEAVPEAEACTNQE